jgi:PAS domain S-box-containing protein
MGMNPPNGGISQANAAFWIIEKVKLAPQDFRELFETCPMPMFIFNAESLRFLAVNSAAANLYGFSQEEFLSRTLSDIQPEPELTSFLQVLKENQAGFTRHGVWRQRTKEGRQVDLDLSWASLPVEGKPCRLMLVHDITERRWAEHLLSQVHGHTEMQLGARTMELDASAQETESFAQALLKRAGASALAPDGAPASHKLQHMCEGLLRLSRLTYTPLRPQNLDLAALARRIGDQMQQQDPSHSVEFKVTCEIKVHADPVLMEVVLTNLFRNAWVYTRQSGKAIIEFGAETGDEEIIFHVRDDGVGFEQAMAEKLFLPFQRFNPEHQGEGIGLSIVRRIIAKHSGRVWAQGTPNRGATIYFTLPPAREPASGLVP